MSQEGLKRKLAAILSADVKGVQSPHARRRGNHNSNIDRISAGDTSLIDQHHGRVVDSVGDNLLAEFASVVDAVQGAVAIQKEVSYPKC